MFKQSSSFQRSFFIFLICFTLLQASYMRNSFSNLDLSSQTLNPTSTGFMVTGNSASDSFGFSVSRAGDINNDGYDDIIVGGYQKNSNQGISYVIYGGQESTMLNIFLSSTTLDPHTTGFTITGDSTLTSLGISASTAGDINNDGYDDIIIGASRRNNYQGAAYVIYGGPKSSMSNWDFSSGVSLNPTSTGFMIIGDNTSGPSSLGISVGTAGDINKDGYDDIIIGSPNRNGNRGAVYVIYGGPKSAMSNWDFSSGATLNPTSTGFMITGHAASDFCGYWVSAAGDINNDGYDDIIIGAPYKSSMRGAAYVIYGGPKSTMSNILLVSTTLVPTSTGFMLTGNAAGNYFGWSVRTAGDINKDGYDDIVVGAYAKNNQGAVYVIYGGPKSAMSNLDFSSGATLNPTSTGFMITGNAAGDQLGYSVGKAGDINKDGYDDIIVGAPSKNSNQGTVYVIYGGPKSAMTHIPLISTTLDPLTTGFMITGNTAGDYFGRSVGIAGDINKDGYDDIIVGASGKGSAYVIYASCSKNCKQCSSESVCTECHNSYLMYKFECFNSCPAATLAISSTTCKDCPIGCFTCSSQTSCTSCSQGYTLSDSLCIESISSLQSQQKASQGISSAAQGIGSAVSVGSTVFPLSALVSKIVQNTRYMNLSVTNDLEDVYQTWDTDLISWDAPNIFSSENHFKSSPFLFARYDLDSPFLVNFWPTLLNIGIGFGTFIACILLQKLFEHNKYKGWAYSLLLKFVAGSFNFAFIQAYSCLDDILFYLVLDAKTNPFNSFLSWASMIWAVIFLALGCLLVFFNFWTVKKYQSIKNQGTQEIEAFNERNKYWELFYSDFNDQDLWSQSFFALCIIRSSLSSFIITVLYDYPLMQTPFLLILDGAILFFLYFKTPFNTLRGKLAQYYYETITLLVHLCAFILALQDSFEKSSSTVRLIMSTGILYFNTALVGGSLGFMFIEIYKTISQKTRAAKRKKYQHIAIQTGTDGSLTTSQDQRRLDSSVDHQQTSFENLHLLRGMNQKSSSPILESNLNSGKDQSTGSIFTRHQIRILKNPRQPKK